MDCQRLPANKKHWQITMPPRWEAIWIKSWPWCSCHAEEFCNQRKCAARMNENFWSFSFSTDRPKTNLGYLWITQLTFFDSAKLNNAENWRGTMSCSIVLISLFFCGYWWEHYLVFSRWVGGDYCYIIVVGGNILGDFKHYISTWSAPPCQLLGNWFLCIALVHASYPAEYWFAFALSKPSW